MSCAGAQPLFMTRMVLETRAAPMAAGAHVSTWRGVGLGLGLTLSLTLTLTLNSNPNPKRILTLTLTLRLKLAVTLTTCAPTRRRAR